MAYFLVFSLSGLERCVVFRQTFETFGRLLGFVRPANPGSDDRRLWDRTSCDVITTCRPANRSEVGALEARIRNISPDGLGMLVGASFLPGSLVSINLPGEGELTQVLAIVVRCESARQPGWFEVGCRFPQVLLEDDLARFQSNPVNPNRLEWRKHIRRECRGQVLYLLMHESASQELIEVAVRDISLGGISLEVKPNVRVGDVLNLDFYRDKKFLESVLASVVRSQLISENNLLIGCTFRHELREELLEQLI
ncbi:MAG: PilZ domain-containing protein [Planctomycetia bacterium]|nr:PilZ domain-containing protein [Planctomycetia bacterium]